jgi:hypothetical protein
MKSSVCGVAVFACLTSTVTVGAPGTRSIALCEVRKSHRRRLWFSAPDTLLMNGPPSPWETPATVTR